VSLTQEQPQAQPPSQPVVTHRDVQRGAMRDLAALSIECATSESQIERQYEQSLEHNDKELERSTWTTEERYKQLCEEIRQKYEQRHAEIAAQYETELKHLQASRDSARQRIDQELDSSKGQINQQYEQAAWLAESVLEGTQAKIREDVKKAKEEQAARTHAVDELSDQGLALLRKYGVRPPVEPQHALPQVAPEQADQIYDAQHAAMNRQLAALQGLALPKLFVEARPYLLLMLCAVVGGVIAQLASGSFEPNLVVMFMGAGIAFVVGLAGGYGLRALARSQVRSHYLPLRHAAAVAREAIRMQMTVAVKYHERRLSQAVERRKGEDQVAREKVAPFLGKIQRSHEEKVKAIDAEYEKHLPRIEQKRDSALAALEQWHEHKQQESQQRYQRSLHTLKEKHQQQKQRALEQHAQARAALERQLSDGLSRITSAMDGLGAGNGAAPSNWDDPAWNTWVPPRQFPAIVPFGQFQVNLRQLAETVQGSERIQSALPEAFSLPASLGFPNQASLLLHTDGAGRMDGVRLLQTIMARLLTSLPAGRLRFTIMDPVGLGQNFAGFMHLADHDENLVGTRIWTEAEHIEQRLLNLTEHMETVIQKYLRNEYQTIDQYNAQAGELAEPYRFLVIADFPTAFAGDAFRRLASIATTGPRCGVYTLILRDLRQSVPSASHFDEVESHSVNLLWQDGRFVWKDEVFKQFPLTVQSPPDEDVLKRLLDVVGRHAREANKVEVSFSTVAPSERHFWSQASSTDLAVPIGRMGATRLQYLRLGRGVAQHTLIAGKTGSGKSNLLNAIVTNMAMWYSPEEVEFYLVDFKKGVEFKTYATYALPHARAVAVESDREFGLSVLQRVDAELTRRGEMFRNAGVQDLASFREASPNTRLPRTLLIIDEFQEFFSEDDKIGQEAGLLLDRLVRQGRAFGIHVILGSQTIGGTSGLARSTIGQMAVRIALQCSEADSQMILGDNNSAARLLSRPGEAIYNDAGGLVEGNSPFQIAFLPDDQRELYLQRVQQFAASKPNHREPPIVFEGNAPAEVTKNAQLVGALSAPRWTGNLVAPMAWLGDPVAIKEPTAVLLRRQSGSNVLIIGQNEEAAMAILSSSMISLAAQISPRQASFYIFDGSAADSPLAGTLARVAGALPHASRNVEFRDVNDALGALAEEMQRRQESQEPPDTAVFVLIYGLQRYRALRRQEETFSFSADAEKKTAAPDKQFADLLREGPALGIHILTWADTPASVERTLDRTSMREFDTRVLFQMSAADSSNLIDSPAANKLGFHRALAYSEERGTIEKFRPYALPSEQWLQTVRSQLATRGEQPAPLTVDQPAAT